MIAYRKAAQRGVAEYGWLSSRYTFSFGSYCDDKQIGFSDLLVINDHRMIGGRGLRTHLHRDMEIFSYVLDGALEHKDCMGAGTVIKPGDVHMMRGGAGVDHNEFNHSITEELRFLQIWIVPDRRGFAPHYQQSHFPKHARRGQLRLIVSPDGAVGSLTVYQDVRVYAGLFDGVESQELTIPNGRYAYVHVARGTVAVNGSHLREGDSACARQETKLTLSDGTGAEILIFELRPRDSPELLN